MKSIGDILSEPNIWLVSLFVGAIVRTVRQVVSTDFEDNKVYRFALKVVPALLGGVLAIIPVLRPEPQSWLPSALWGVIAGTFAQTAYGALRSAAPERIRDWLGSKSKRNSRVTKGG